MSTEVLKPSVAYLASGLTEVPALIEDDQVGVLIAEVGRLQSQVRDCNEKSAQLSDTNDRLQRQVTDLTSANDELQCQVTELTNTNDALQQQVTELTSVNDALQRQVTGLTTKLRDLEKKSSGSINMLRQRVATLEAQNEKLETKLKRATKMVDYLQTILTSPSPKPNIYSSIET